MGWGVEERRGGCTLVSEFRGVGGGAYDGEVGRGEKGAGCCFGCHRICWS